MKYLALLFLPLCVLAGENRTWTDTAGRSFSGGLISVQDGTASIRRESDQRIFDVPLDTLSEADRTYIQANYKEPNYHLQDISIALDGTGKEDIDLRIEYNHRTVWEGSTQAPGPVDLDIYADTNFNEEPKRGYAKNDRIYLYFQTPNYAAQWHQLELNGDKLKLKDNSRIRLHKKKYAIIEYAFYQGDNPDFTNREPTYSGVAAVGHWGTLPGFRHDWQLWQGDVEQSELWGKTLLLEHHRGNNENGMTEARGTDFSRLNHAPEEGYTHFGSCGEPSLEAKNGKSYYCRVTGHTNSTRGYGKIHIKDIVDQPPAGMEVLER